MTAGRGRRVRRLMLDVSPLRDLPQFRLLWAGQSINVIGNQITRVALPYQAYVITHSTLAIAALAFVQLVPYLLFGLVGGALADAWDRRRLMLVAQVGMAVTSLFLALVSIAGDPPVALLFVLAFASSVFSAVERPTRTSSTPRLVPPERLAAAMTLNHLSFNAGSVAGPALGGAILATVGVAGAYAVDVVTFVVSIAAVLALRPIPPLGEAARPGLEAVREGLRFVRSKRLIQGAFAIDLNAMIFGMPSSLFPALALDVFQAGPVGVGLLNAAPAAGAFAAALVSGAVTRLRRAGLAIIVSVAVWGAGILLFGLATFSFPLALFFLAVAGGADVVSTVLRASLIQLVTPDALRGRVSSIHIVVVTSGPRIGDMEAAVVAAAVGPQLSVISGGLLCILGVFAVARYFPELRAYAPEVSGRPA